MAAIRFSRGAAAALLALAACSEAVPPPPPPAPETYEAAAPQGSPNCDERSFEGSRFTVCAIDTARDEVRLAWRGADGRPLRSLAALEGSLGADAARVRFAMNAGMYDEEGAPIGLFVEQGEERKTLSRKGGSGNFHLLPNGVFAVDARGQLSVTATTAFRKQVPAPVWATQSGPMLVIDDKLHPKFDANGTSQLVRNGVGVARPDKAFLVMSEDGVSFGRFARLFRDELGCRNALYLDGSVSSLWDPGSGRQDAYSQLGPMIVVLRRPAS